VKQVTAVSSLQEDNMQAASNTMVYGAASPSDRAAMPTTGSAIPMAAKLAYRNLFHDRLSLTVTLVGIVFSVVLVAVQFGLYLGSENRIAAMLDHAQGDLWVVPLGTKSFDDPALLPGREKHVILSTPGVAGVEELVVGFVNWRKPAGGSTAALLVGSQTTSAGNTLPWDVVDGGVAALSAPSAVAVDRTYFTELGVGAIGDRAEVNNMQVTVAAVTQGIRSFTTLPYVFTTLAQARTLLEASPEQTSYTLVRVGAGSDVGEVRKALAPRLPDAEIVTHQEFRKRSLDYWLFETGAGSALIAGAALGIIVGIVIVAQTLYSSTKDHLNEFATLRALGASARYIHKVILLQAVLSALIGYGCGIALSLFVIWASRDTTLLIVMTPNLALMLFALTVGMCVLAAICAIFKVTRIDPAVVFSR
jgi:putative ABC transport system permease protein